MPSSACFKDVQGILTILSENHNFPNSANLYAIPDEKGFSLIDVGCGGYSGIENLKNGLAYWGLDLQKLHTVVLSHAHPDHMGAISWIMENVNPTVYIHDLEVTSAMDSVNLLDTFDISLAKEKFIPPEEDENFQKFDLFKVFTDSGCNMGEVKNLTRIHDGDILSMGDFSFQVLHTPGHSPGHISLFEKNHGILFAGDLIGVTPAWYSPSSGGVTGYLDSLSKFKALAPTTILPSHGPIIEDPSKVIKKFHKNLLRRESILLKTLSAGPKSFMELNQTLFKLVFVQFLPGSGILESHLIKLEKEGGITRKGDLISHI